MNAPTDQEIVALYQAEQLSLREIVARTGVPYRVARQVIHAAGVMRTDLEGRELNRRLGKRGKPSYQPPERPAGYYHARAARGERHPRAVLTEEKVRHIKRNPKKTASQLAVEVDASKAAVRDVRAGRTWVHVK